MNNYTDMTDEEYDALDEILTKTTPKIKKGSGGIFTENRTRMLLLDETTIRILNAQAMAVHQSPSEYITKMIRQGITSSI